MRTIAGALAIALATLLGYLWWSHSGGPPPAANTQPEQNVLLITIDTLRADALGSYGGRASTPNLDRLASRGLRFTFAHAHSVVTLPSHATILTGRLPFDHGIRDNSGYRVKAGTATLATRLKAAGYSTGAFVAGFPLTKQFGLAPGFDEYDDEIPELRTGGALAMPERRADAVVARATQWISRQSGRFFSWVHVFDPHSPYAPPDEYLKRSPDRPYDAEVSWTDAALAPLLEKLPTLTRPTLVIVTSDHGESLGEHDELTHGMFAYESTLRVPLIITTVVPAGQPDPQGSVVDTPARLIDIAPTVLEAAGLPADPALPGAPLGPTDQSVDRPTYFEALTYNLVRGWAPLTGVIAERSKYIDLPIREYYDLAADPRELKNLAPTSAGRVQELAQQLAGFNATAPQRPGRESAGTSAALKSLGYLSGSAAPKTAYTEADDPKRLVEIDRDLQRANDLEAAGRIDDTIALLRSVIARRKDTADAYVSLAHVLWGAGRPKDAIATLEQALAAGAPDHELRLRLGLYLAESGTDPRRGVALLEQLAKDDVQVLNALGIAQLAAGRSDEAARALRAALVLDPTNGLAYQNLAAIRLREAQMSPPDARPAIFREAEELLRQAVAADPGLAKAYTTLGVVHAQTSRKAEAIESWKRAIALSPAEFDALYNLTVTLVETGQVDEARRYARQFVDTAPSSTYGPSIRQLQEFLKK